MQLEDLKKFIIRVKTATGRQITEEQIALIYQDIRHFSDELYTQICTRYLDNEEPPRNIVKYFNNERIRITHEAEQKNKQQTPFEAGLCAGDEVTYLQYKMFFVCVRMALNCSRLGFFKYAQWVAWFNERWELNFDNDLDIFLQNELNRLMEILSRRNTTDKKPI